MRGVTTPCFAVMCMARPVTCSVSIIPAHKHVAGLAPWHCKCGGTSCSQHLWRHAMDQAADSPDNATCSGMRSGTCMADPMNSLSLTHVLPCAAYSAAV